MAETNNFNSASRIRGSGVISIPAGETKEFKPSDFGGGQRQFAVSTTQAIGAALEVYLCDPDGFESSPIHPGPPITFETDSPFKVKNTGAGANSVIVAVVQLSGFAPRQGQAGNAAASREAQLPSGKNPVGTQPAGQSRPSRNDYPSTAGGFRAYQQALAAYNRSR